ncbi:20S proteasome, regulatory subunit beta type PSMB3/PUP3 [Pseudoloma neurophilia]|uniref:20S proteasome, regulatory subunit beta type PSMB3/PUP3 n=1 Tax=Pseudoloma neurophilia TaxID=146866 RepID=A0A0R0M470_9MICR|nr:20S proteasome, regulatory subunit beta type PSMB3/PUP3 [Pseudoloma neurophilia]
MSDISTYYGGSVLALKGATSALIISDTRLGARNLTSSCNFERIKQITPHSLIGFTMFAPDGQMMIKDMIRESRIFEVTNNRELDIKELASCLSHYLYTNRTMPRYIEPIIAGIDDQNRPYINAMDCLGCGSEYDFVAGGTSVVNLMGLAEALFIPNLDDQDLFTTGMQIFLNAVDRDALSGWGATAFLINSNGIIKREVKARMD